MLPSKKKVFLLFRDKIWLLWIRNVITCFFLFSVKKGRCPENPRGAWICADSCTGDSDCVRALKCCHNRCGALTCQKPEPEPETTVPTPTTLAPVVSDKPLYNPEPTFNPLNPFFPSAPLYNPSRIPSNNWGPAPFPANSVPFPSVPFPYGPGSYPVGPTAPTSFSGFPEFHFLTPTSSAVRPAFPDFSENTRDRSASQPRSNNRVSWPDDNNVRG